MPQHDWEILNKEIRDLQTLPFYKSDKGKINVSETFYTVQGEGPKVGQPTVFLRVQGCNLLCKWPCDTIPVWRKGTQYTYEELLKMWRDEGWVENIQRGAYITLTGGEPLLRQEELLGFINYFKDSTKITPVIDVETNGTTMPHVTFDKIVSQYCVSPKLANSEMDRTRRIRPDVIKFMVDSKKAIFKFVIDTPQDALEMYQDYIEPFKIPNNTVYLMPECVDKKELEDKGPWVAEFCKANNYNFGNRLHIILWDQVTGV